MIANESKITSCPCHHAYTSRFMFKYRFCFATCISEVRFVQPRQEKTHLSHQSILLALHMLTYMYGTVPRKDT
jgi:hypothetical protein